MDLFSIDVLYNNTDIIHKLMALWFYNKNTQIL